MRLLRASGSVLKLPEGAGGGEGTLSHMRPATPRRKKASKSAKKPRGHPTCMVKSPESGVQDPECPVGGSLSQVASIHEIHCFFHDPWSPGHCRQRPSAIQAGVDLTAFV